MFFCFFLSWVSEPTLYYFTLEPGLVGLPSLSGRESQSIPPGPVTLTSADGGKVPHVVEKFADDGTGPGVQAVAADPQVELDPAGLQVELQWGIQGSEIQLLFVYPVSPERAGRVFLQLREQESKDLPKRLVWTLRPSFIWYLICMRLEAVLRVPRGTKQPQGFLPSEGLQSRERNRQTVTQGHTHIHKYLTTDHDRYCEGKAQKVKGQIRGLV